MGAPEWQDIHLTMTATDKILVTGSTGFIGAHCVGLLLLRNYRVKAHTRSMEKFHRLQSCVPEDKRHLLLVSIGSDITNTDEMALAMESCSGVLHLASPFNFAVNDFVDDLLVPALKGTEAIMEAAYRTESVKRVVLTSSFAAVYDASLGAQPDKVLTEQDFSPLTWEDGVSTKDPAVAYRVSKTIAERAAWDFMEQKSPAFDLCVLCPTMVFGPLYLTALISKLSELNFSNQLILKLMDCDAVPPTRNPVWVDVRDLAEYHVCALTEPAASNQRFLISAGDYDNQEIADALRANLPSKVAKGVPVGAPGERITGTHYTTDSTKGKEVFGIQYRSLECSVTDLAQQLMTFSGL